MINDSAKMKPQYYQAITMLLTTGSEIVFLW